MDSGFTLEELKLALSMRVVHMVMTSDHVIHAGEVEFLQRHFPEKKLLAHDFLDAAENRFTHRFGLAIAAAPPVLTSVLSPDEKLDMVRLFFGACKADNDVDPRELSVVVQGARMIGLGQEPLVKELTTLMGGRPTSRPIPPQPDPNAAPGRTSLVLTPTRDGTRLALASRPTDPAADIDRRAEDVLRGKAGLLSLVVGPLDYEDLEVARLGRVLELLAEEDRLLPLAGRLDLAFEGRDEGPREPHVIPDIRDWLVSLAAFYPWFPTWLVPAGGVAAQILASCVPGDTRKTENAVRFIDNAIGAATYGAAFTHGLGGKRLDHVYAYLSEFGLSDLPTAFFEGVEGLAVELDAAGRRNV